MVLPLHVRHTSPLATGAALQGSVLSLCFLSSRQSASPQAGQASLLSAARATPSSLSLSYENIPGCNSLPTDFPTSCLVLVRMSYNCSWNNCIWNINSSTGLPSRFKRPSPSPNLVPAPGAGSSLITSLLALASLLPSLLYTILFPADFLPSTSSYSLIMQDRAASGTSVFLCLLFYYIC